MVAHNLGNQCQTKAAAALLCRDEGVEQMWHQIFRDARPIVPDAELERKRNTCLAARHGQAHTGTKSGRQLYFAIACPLADGFGGILEQVEKDLNELVAIGQNRWQ